jgi:hypothetical protein
MLLKEAFHFKMLLCGKNALKENTVHKFIPYYVRELPYNPVQLL